ncbi:hypothetical protein Thiowin_03677 [Thiorhodovibrio winogradskyi]|uniref:Uncharacterized protein n=1 Tax=Thiorhodovibrio winogradskyi TaxID=77007 RepID=A0ABZ0SE67_9GAMM
MSKRGWEQRKWLGKTKNPLKQLDESCPRGLSPNFAKNQETAPVCHAFLHDANFYQLLTRIDESIAEEARARL